MRVMPGGDYDQVDFRIGEHLVRARDHLGKSMSRAYITCRDTGGGRDGNKVNAVCLKLRQEYAPCIVTRAHHAQFHLRHALCGSRASEFQDMAPNFALSVLV